MPLVFTGGVHVLAVGGVRHLLCGTYGPAPSILQGKDCGAQDVFEVVGRSARQTRGQSAAVLCE